MKLNNEELSRAINETTHSLRGATPNSDERDMWFSHLESLLLVQNERAIATLNIAENCGRCGVPELLNETKYGARLCNDCFAIETNSHV